MVMFLALHPMESLSLNPFVLLEHIAMLLTGMSPEVPLLQSRCWWESVFMMFRNSAQGVMSPGWGGGGTLIFSHIRRLGPFFWIQNSEFQYFLGFSEKWIFFWSMKILWKFFWGHHKIGLVWGSFLCNLVSFFKVKEQNWDIFLGC